MTLDSQVSPELDQPILAAAPEQQVDGLVVLNGFTDSEFDCTLLGCDARLQGGGRLASEPTPAQKSRIAARALRSWS